MKKLLGALAALGVSVSPIFSLSYVPPSKCDTIKHVPKAPTLYPSLLTLINEHIEWLEKDRYYSLERQRFFHDAGHNENIMKFQERLKELKSSSVRLLLERVQYAADFAQEIHAPREVINCYATWKEEIVYRQAQQRNKCRLFWCWK